ncbi:Uncharacterised protein [Klebsiella pneumoniae]|nr:Uncharacterised protein [Klebsiella pneumoniae]SXD02191.1 Uncharacterised protein [Klebsiella quasipneumoniae]SXX92409.1 Uncharacterised protein [Klebsiella pneumoniae]SYQ86486.1 Uncharacterised protein [Klebsiella pneumoniae]VAT81561.1 Uncharacterised protein [Klebsiella pneumoniae]
MCISLRCRLRLLILSLLLPVLFRFQFINGFQLKTILEHDGHFVTGTNRNDRVILLGPFDVVLAQRLRSFRCTTAYAHFQNITGANRCGCPQANCRL